MVKRKRKKMDIHFSEFRWMFEKLWIGENWHSGVTSVISQN